MNIFKFSNFNLEAEGEESISITGQPCQFSEFQLSQIYIKRLCLKKKNHTHRNNRAICWLLYLYFTSKEKI